MAALTDKQAMFVKEYLVDLNATQAAIRAGYSPNTANEIGCQNLAKLNIAAAIQEEMDKRSEKVEISSEYVLKTIKETTDKCVKDNLHKEVFKGCELLGKHLKLFTDKIEHTGEDGNPIEHKWTVELVDPEGDK